MARDLELWGRIKADYLVTGKSYPQLANEYGVSLSSLKKVAAKESWAQERNTVDSGVMAPAARNRGGTGTASKEPEPEGALVIPTETVIEVKRERLEKFLEITDGMMDRILEAIQSPEVISPYAMKMLSSALRDLREMQGLNRTELDIEEQRARIAKLKQETQITEPSGQGLVIEFVDTDGAEE